MIAWIKKTFFPDADVELLLVVNARLRRELDAREAAYASELTFYHREIKRLHGEIGQLLNGMEVKG